MSTGGAYRAYRDRGYAILEPLLGPDITAVVNTLFWKPPGEPATAIASHQDAATSSSGIRTCFTVRRPTGRS